MYNPQILSCHLLESALGVLCIYLCSHDNVSWAFLKYMALPLSRLWNHQKNNHETKKKPQNQTPFFVDVYEVRKE